MISTDLDLAPKYVDQGSKNDTEDGFKSMNENGRIARKVSIQEHSRGLMDRYKSVSILRSLLKKYQPS